MLAILLAALESEADKQKFTDIYEQYHPQMEQTALRILKNQHDAEDAVQNAFMQIIRHFEKIDEIPCEKLLIRSTFTSNIASTRKSAMYWNIATVF